MAGSEITELLLSRALLTDQVIKDAVQIYGRVGGGQGHLQYLRGYKEGYYTKVLGILDERQYWAARIGTSFSPHTMLVATGVGSRIPPEFIKFSLDPNCDTDNQQGVILNNRFKSAWNIYLFKNNMGVVPPQGDYYGY